MKLILVVCLIVSAVSVSKGQIIAGAKENSIANSGVALSNDVFALFNNPAGLSQMNWREVGIFYSPAPFGFKELATGFISYNEPLPFGSAGIGGMTYGFELYRETKLIAAYSHNFSGSFFVGISGNYHSVSIEKYGSNAVFYFNIGGLAYITPDLRLGFFMSNINRASFGNEEDQIPVIFYSGFSYNFIPRMSFNTAIEKDIRYNASLKFGIDYNVINNFSLRTGFSNEPSNFSAGIGIHYKFLNLDYAVYTHQDLGLTHQAGIIIGFQDVENRYEKIRQFLK